MLLRSNERLLARIEGRRVRVACLRGARVLQEVIAECDRPPAGLDDAIDKLAPCLDELKVQHRISGVRCDVIVADTWVAYEVVPADLDEVPESAAEEIVRTSLADALGAKADELTVRWQQQRSQHSLACALPRRSMERLRAVLAAAAVQLGRVEGEFVHAFNARRAELAVPHAVLAVVRDAGTQLGLLLDRAVVSVRFEPGARTADRLQGDVAGLLRCAGVSTEATIRCVGDAAADAALPADWAASETAALASRRPRALDLDLARSRPRVSPLRRLTLAAGIAAAIAAVLSLQVELAERDRILAEQTELQAALGAVRSPRTTPPTPAAARAAKTAAAVIRDLTVPWPALMGTFEAASGSSVALLAVEPTSHRNEVRFTAEAKTSSAMLDYLDALRGATLTEVTLVSHQAQPQTPGVPIRFQGRAMWARPDRLAQANR